MKNLQIASSERRKAYEHVAMSLAMRYDTIYYVDVDTCNYIVFSSTDTFKMLELPPTGGDYFAGIRERFRELIHPEDLTAAAFTLEREAMLAAIARERVPSATFRVLSDGAYRFINVQAMWADDNKHLVVGIKDVDDWESRRREAERQTRIYSAIAHTLARRYDSIYYLDLETGDCSRFTTVDDGGQGSVMQPQPDFFEMIRERTERDIHRDDRAKMRQLAHLETLLSAVDQEGVLSVTVRLKREARYVFTNFRCMRAEDHRHIIIAVSDVDRKVRLRRAQEQSLRDAEKRAMRDELTRVRNKNAYAELEEELQHAIDDGNAGPLAIVVCDVNDLKGVNDYLGHKAGDALLQDACKRICVTFAHSPVFRVGGDEFAVVLRGEDFDNRRKLIQRLHAESLANLRAGGAVVAVGMSDYQGDSYVTDVFERADRDMYENKRALKDEAAKIRTGDQ